LRRSREHKNRDFFLLKSECARLPISVFFHHIVGKYFPENISPALHRPIRWIKTHIDIDSDKRNRGTKIIGESSKSSRAKLSAPPETPTRTRSPFFDHFL